MTDALKTLIHCHGTDAGETWECSLMRGDMRIAFVTGLSSHAQARDAAEYLQLGVGSRWQVMPRLDADIQAAGVEALKAERYIAEDDEHDLLTVDAAWHAMTEAWLRKIRAAAGLDKQA